MLLYALLHLSGFEDVSMDEIKSFRQWGSKTPGHPEFGHTAGIDATTGPLGQGISTATGFARYREKLYLEWGCFPLRRAIRLEKNLLLEQISVIIKQVSTLSVMDIT